MQLHSLWGGSAVGVAMLAPNGSAMCCIMFAVVFARTLSLFFVVDGEWQPEAAAGGYIKLTTRAGALWWH